MMYAAGRAVFAVALVVASVAALPNHLKAVVVDSDPVPVVKEVVPVVRTKAASGYSASAGVGGAGVYAAADSPLGSASAGLGDSGPSLSVGSQQGPTGHKPVHYGPGLFDSIFNIPISVLQSVNTYLNNRGPITKPAYRRRGHPHRHPVAEDKAVVAQGQSTQAAVPEVAPASVSSSAEAAADSAAHSSGGAGAHPLHTQGPVVLQKRVNYDDIFNIPISVLKSVNQLLNGNGK